MRIQPIDASQQLASFQAMKLPKLKTKPRRANLATEQEQNKHCTQAVLFSFAFIAAAFTKYFIDLCNSRQKPKATVETPAKQPTPTDDTNTYQLK